MKRSAKTGNTLTSSPSASFGGARGFGGFSTTTLSYITPPPDLSNIPPSIVVPFKNLLKKDSITKAKALDDIIPYVQRHDGELEEAILDTWVQLYARIAIDNSRRVRELSHILLFELLKHARKRMEKRIPSIVGPWLAGTFDRDRVVSRAAGDGLSSLLDTKEKENKFWARCQGQILKYATDAMLETPDTLSDEKSTNKEDALAKYYRAIGGSLSLIFGLVNRADLSGIEQELSRYLEVEAVWAMAAAEEPFVRRTLFQLLQTLLDKKPEVLRPRLTQMGRALVADSFKSSQSGSATDLTKALAKLTRLFPEVWGTKTHPLQRLRPFAEKGSQGGSPIYWEALDYLLKALPEKATSAETGMHFLKSLRIGITNRLEPRSNATQGWITYINAFERLLGVISPDVSFVKEAFYPLVRQYLHPSPELITWTSPTPTALSSKLWKILANHADANIRNSVGEEWQGFQESFLLRLTNSLPEVSKEYQSSQQSVAADGERWFSLSGGIMRELGQGTTDGGEAFLRNAIAEASTTVLRGALDLLIRRNYKPFGAASVIQAAFTKSPSLCVNDEFVMALFPTGSPDKLKLLVSSPSFAYLIPCLDALSTLRHDKFSQVWPELVDSALQCDAETSASAANKLISVAGATALAQPHEQLQAYLASQWLGCAGGNGSPLSWSLCESSLTFSTINDESLASVIADIVRQFDVAGNTSSSLQALELITNHKPTLVSQHKAAHVELVTKLLALTEISDNAISGRAASLQAHLDQKSAGQSPLVGVIQSHLEDAGASSIGIDVLIQRAVATFKSGGVPLEELFPSTNTWLSELAGFLRSAPKASVSLTSAMGGAYLLVRSGDEGRQNPPRRDGKGRSIPARMAVYASTLLSSEVPSSSLPEAFHLELLYLTALTGELAADQLTTLESDGLWGIMANETHASAEVEEFVTSCRDLLNGVAENTTSWRTGGLSGTTVAERLLNLALQHAQDLTPTSLYSAKVFSNLLQALVESQGIPSQLDEWLGKLGVLKVTPNTVFPAIACLVGFGEVLASSELAKNLCNRLVSEMIGALPGAPRTLYSIVLLNVCIAVFEPGQVPVDTRKQTLALKQITSWMATPDEMGSGLAAEACKWSQRIFPSVKGIYGPYWEQTLDYCIYLWTKKAPRDAADARLPYVHASLKLIGCIMDEEDKNEDLQDALSQRVEAISKGLIELLKVPTQVSQAGQIVDSLVARMVGNVPLEHVGDLSELYGLVASDSSGVQSAAFRILHRALPAVQAKLSVDVLLDKRDASLPDELLSLLLDAPTLEMYPEEVLVQFPAPIRSYLLAWHLIFDAYSTASLKVQNDYSESLKKQNFVVAFFNFMFDVLGHSAGYELNLDREGFTKEMIRCYDIKLAESEVEERNMQWLLVHLLFRALMHIPGLFRMWYLECGDKQTKNTLSAWLVKYFSPLIISDALDQVTMWAEQQEEPADDEKELLVKVSRAAREVTAGYEVDEEVASLLIRIPPAFPLETVEVVGIKRVAVSEKKWQAWLLATQGVIKFGNGGIIDGLATFRRNIVGTLKGQTECAICYSIVSSDKMLPDKECGTCRHSFHRICLFKWFQNSGRNTCPLCRNSINYLGSDTKRNMME